MVMAHMVRDLVRTQIPPKEHKITKEQYLAWKRGFIFEAMRDLRYGQSFCKHFDIFDNILFYESDTQRAMHYIEKNYVS